MAEVRLRGGGVARPSGESDRWGPGLIVAGIGRVWRPRFNRNRELQSYLNARGERVEMYDPRCHCASCAVVKNSHTDRPPPGWVKTDAGFLCTKCKREKT